MGIIGSFSQGALRGNRRLVLHKKHALHTTCNAAKKIPRVAYVPGSIHARCRVCECASFSFSLCLFTRRSERRKKSMSGINVLDWDLHERVDAA